MPFFVAFFRNKLTIIYPLHSEAEWFLMDLNLSANYYDAIPYCSQCNRGAEPAVVV